MKTARRPRATRAAAGLLAALFVAALAGGPVRADTESQLKTAKAKLGALIDQIEAEQETIATLQSEVNGLAVQIDEVQTRMTRTQARVVNLQQQIRDATDVMEATQDQLNRRARQAYEAGPGSQLGFILGSTSLSDLALRLQIVDNAAEDDSDLIAQLEAQKADLQARRVKLKALEADLRATQADLRDTSESISTKLEQAEALKIQLEANRAEAEVQVTELEKKLRAEELARERARLAALRAQQDRESEQTMGGGGGNWVQGMIKVCPVQGSVAFSDDFGAPRFGGGYHPHAGNDIFAAPDTPILSPFDGTAVDSSNGLGGIAVKVYGSDGWVYQAHMSRFGKLGSVRTGDVIGYVGDTGDAPGIYHDHFEWHPNVIPPNPWTSPYGYSVINGDAVDPYPYLAAVC